MSLNPHHLSGTRCENRGCNRLKKNMRGGNAARTGAGACGERGVWECADLCVESGRWIG